MLARFGEVFPNSGVDEHTPTGNVGMIVPLRGSNFVALGGGQDLVVTSTNPVLIKTEEVLRWPLAVASMILPISLLIGSVRIFRVKSFGLTGIDKVKVEAKNPKTSKVEATLKVLVLKEKVVKIAIRPVQTREGASGPASAFTNGGDPQKLLDEMNVLWNAQANVVFQLGMTRPAIIDGLSPKTIGADIKNSTTLPSFVKERDPNAQFTAFLVRRAIDGKTGLVPGVTDEQSAFCLIGDDRSENTLAHEAGHYLGSHGDSGKFSQHYGHPGPQDAEFLTRDGGAGKKIAFGQVTDFNMGYR